ncbi:MAG: hypothetical protein V4540_03470 [Pseudomonadota bacterium]
MHKARTVLLLALALFMHDFFDADARQSIKFDANVIVLEVECEPCVEAVRANVFTPDLRTDVPRARARVEWFGVDVISSAVFTDVDPEPWKRRLEIVWAVVGPDIAPVDGKFDSQRWTRMKLSMPDSDVSSGDRIVVAIDRATWTATWGRSTTHDHDLGCSIPNELRELDAGSLLVEMSARLMLHVGMV